MHRIILIFASLVFTTICFGQEDVIPLKNGSFEDNPRAGGVGGYDMPIKNWYDCGSEQFPHESPPDIHPVDFWKVTKKAIDGETYLGLIVRDNESWESVSQRLSEPLEADKCYKFSVYLSRSDKLVSSTDTKDTNENFDEPAILRVWGGQGYCGSVELLGESSPVANFEWKKFEIDFKLKKEHRFIMLEAFYKTPVLFPYNGHILVDGASDITRVACPGEDYVAAPPPPKKKKPKKKKKEEPKKDEITTNAKKENPVNVSKPVKPKLLVELDRSTIKKGQTINIDNLYFAENSSTIGETSYPILEEVYEFLDENQDIFVELGGHTSAGSRGITHAFCDKLSNDRAKAVASYLISKGIHSEQLKFKGYGKRKPIASNRTKEGRLKNQRVEIKILNVQ